MSTESSIKCPNCGELIDVNEILYHQLENEFKQKNLNEKKKFEEEIALKRVEYKQALDMLKQKEEDIKEQKEKLDLFKSTLASVNNDDYSDEQLNCFMSGKLF